MALLGACAVIYATTHTENANATGPDEAFYNANIACKAGDHDKAISGYETIINEGFKSGELYYNLATSYLRKGRIGMAILNYEKARLLIPRDIDLLSSFKYALSLMKQGNVNSRDPVFIQKINRIFDYLTFKETLAVFFLCYYGLAFFIIIFEFVKKYRIIYAFIVFLLLCSSILSVIPLSEKVKRYEKEAIVIVPIADSKIEPIADAASNFPLYEGMKVHVLKSNRGWYKIKRLDGKIGWIAADAVGLI